MCRFIQPVFVLSMLDISAPDAFNDRSHKISIPNDEDCRNILSKARGQLARIAMILHSLEQAVEHPMNESCSSGESSTESEFKWNATIKETSVTKAEVVMKFIIEQKFALMQPEVQVVSITNILTGSAVLDENPKYLSKFLTFKNAAIQASDLD